MGNLQPVDIIAVVLTLTLASLIILAAIGVLEVVDENVGAALGVVAGALATYIGLSLRNRSD